jgi:3-oxocholest-4-en-26-oyl-CoA dehydrogenase alpha subunit
VNFSHLELDEATTEFRNDVRAWCDEHVTKDVIDEERSTGAGFSRPLHTAMGERGWILPKSPPELGGAGLNVMQSQILAMELNAHQVPNAAGLSTTQLVVPALDRWVEGELRLELLLGAARGEVVISLGYSEPDGGSDLASVRTRAVRDGDEWVIQGQKMFTTGAQHCNYSFLLTRTDPTVAKHKGLTMFLVPFDRPGIEIQAVHTLAGERTNMVFYDDVRIPDRYRIGPEGQGWMVLHGPLNAEHMMDAEGPKPVEQEAGAMYRPLTPLVLAVAATVNWAQASDPDGNRPLDCASVRERLAEIELGLEVADATPGPAGRVIRSEMFIRDAADLVDLVGPEALVAVGDQSAVGDGAIEFAHRFAQGTAIYGGTTDIIRNLIAERFLGMPRARRAE